MAMISVPWYVERRRKPAVREESDGAGAVRVTDGTAGSAPNGPVSLKSELAAADRRQK